MKQQLAICGAAVLLLFSATAQVPIYNVTVIERTTKAINYQYRSGPTMVDFRGTVLMPEAKGQAIVESKRGRTEIEVSVKNCCRRRVSGASISPTRCGRSLRTARRITSAK